jgi:crotonobetainyl-CoA:carnitine CoA-transferase CaiB-like acyl-CoA transferase
MNRLEDAWGTFLVTRTKAEIIEKAVERSIMMVPITSAKDVMASPQFEAREFFVEVEHPELGQTITYPGFPVKMTRFPYRTRRRAPLIGEHNEEIYMGELGFCPQDMARLKANGVI